jgi:hypothetical protein
MNIDPYYARGTGSAGASFPSSGMSAFNTGRQTQPSYTPMEPVTPNYQFELPAESPQPRPAVDTFYPDAQQMAARERRDLSNFLYNEFPRPALGTIDRNAFNDINAIYYRHYLQGTYGSPEMMEEVNRTLEMIRRARAEAPRGGGKMVMADTGLGTAGTTVVDQREVPYYTRPVDTEARFREALRTQLPRLLEKRGQVNVPVRGGPGGLPGRM